MDEDTLLARYGTHPGSAGIPEIRHLLTEETARGFDADTEAMKLLCIHLFNHGSLDDTLLIWRGGSCHRSTGTG